MGEILYTKKQLLDYTNNVLNWVAAGKGKEPKLPTGIEIPDEEEIKREASIHWKDPETFEQGAMYILNKIKEQIP